MLDPGVMAASHKRDPFLLCHRKDTGKDKIYPWWMMLSSQSLRIILFLSFSCLRAFTSQEGEEDNANLRRNRFVFVTLSKL